MSFPVQTIAWSFMPDALLFLVFSGLFQLIFRVNICTCVSGQHCNSCKYYFIYRTLAIEGPWAVHLTMGQDWGMDQYSRYQYRIWTRKSAQVHVSYPRYLHNLNSSSTTIDFSLIQAQLPIESKGGRLLGR